jgi:hypothetical protein
LLTAAQRVFRKTVFLGDYDWRDPARWEGDVRQKFDKIPLELACYHTLVKKNAARVVRTRRRNYDPHSVDHETLSFKVYTTWCKHGGLDQLIQLYRDENDYLPEPFIWSVAESLCRAGLAMADPNAVPHHSGGQIVHRYTHRDAQC